MAVRLGVWVCVQVAVAAGVTGEGGAAYHNLLATPTMDLGPIIHCGPTRP